MYLCSYALYIYWLYSNRFTIRGVDCLNMRLDGMPINLWGINDPAQIVV